jgi:hypothetical protein
MSEQLALGAALEWLDKRLSADRGDEADIVQVLRVLQSHGLAKNDLVVHVERIRAANDATSRLPHIESNCLLALDLIVGLGTVGLRWDAAQMAVLYLQASLDAATVSQAMNHALAPSDLLPPRPSEGTADSIRALLGAHITSWRDLVRTPIRAVFLRVPKSPFTSRPAAMLAFEDRLCLECVAAWIEESLDSALPQSVIWPRRRSAGAVRQFASAPEWINGAYIVKADIASFYEEVDHGTLASFMDVYLGMPTARVQAAHALLDALMGINKGLPQGPLASDVLASLYLLPVDLTLVQRGWSYARYADDFVIGAESIVDARRKLEELEVLLQGIGLRLNDEKTMVMRRANFLRKQLGPPQKIRRIRDQVRMELEAAIHAESDEDALTDELKKLGVEEETLWDLLYHGSTTIESVLESIRDNLTPTVAEAYGRFLAQEAAALSSGRKGKRNTLTDSEVVEAITFVAGARVIVEWQWLDAVLTWFPRTAPSVAVYLKEIAAVNLGYVGTALELCLAREGFSDWSLAWLVSVVDVVKSAELVKRLLPYLRALVASPQARPLSAVTAVRAMATGRLLAREDWQAVWTNVPAALRAEMLFAAMADSAGYGWAVPSLLNEAERH